MSPVLLKFAALSLLVLVVGCTSGADAFRDSFRGLLPGGEADVPQLKPDLSYLRLGNAGRYAYLGLGYTEAHPAGEIDVWYSAAGEVIKLQGGRVVGTAGLVPDWRAVRLAPLPDWRHIPAAGLSYTREIDQMPGYRFGIRQSLVLRSIPAPTDVSLPRAQPAELSWFEEAQVGASADPLPPVRFAVDLRQTPPRVLYSEQCLTPSLCFSFEPWPATAPPAAPATPGGAS